MELYFPPILGPTRPVSTTLSSIYKLVWVDLCFHLFFLQAILRNNYTVVTQYIVTIVQHLIGIGGVHIDILECVCYVMSCGNHIRNTKTKRNNNNNNNNNNSNKLHITLSDDSWLWGKYHHWIELKNSFPMVYSTITFV